MNQEAVCYQCDTDEEKHRMIYHAKDGAAQCSRCGRPFQVSVLQGPTDDLVGRVAPEEGAPVDGLEPNGGNLYRPHRLMVGQGKFWRCAHGNTGITMGPEPQLAVIWNDCERCAEADPAARAEWIAGHMRHTKEGK